MRISATFVTFVCALAVLAVVPAAAQPSLSSHAKVARRGLGEDAPVASRPELRLPSQSKPRPTRRTVPSTPRVWVGVNSGYQATTTKFEDSFDISSVQETLTTHVTYPVDAGFAFDVGGGVRLWRRLGAGLAVTRFARENHVSTTSSIPHPLYFAQPRQVAGDADGIKREETGIHVQAQYVIDAGNHIQMTLMAGPSILKVNQAVVTGVTYTQEYPYDTATFTGVSSSRVNHTAVGFNAGADVRWMFTRSVGVGGVVRFTRATIDLDVNTPRNRTISVDTGGAHVGAGVRFVF